MANKIYPCLWFDGQAKAAAEFYCSIFSDARITLDTPMVVKFEIEGKEMLGLNGGPMFKITPSVSMMVTCLSNEEIERIWNKLIEGGSAMMPLDKYPWSEKYGWVVDKFGMTWQLMLGDMPFKGQKITPTLLFVGAQYGKAQDAMKHYTEVFHPADILHSELYKEDEGQPAGTLKFGQFSLQNELFSAMDGYGSHAFQFNEAVSFVVECATQKEIDTYWTKLVEGGSESMCGWLKDKFGVSWQIIPAILGEIMGNPEKAQRAMPELLKMKKIDLETLQNA